MKILIKNKWVKRIVLYLIVIGCTVAMISLCFDKGMDYDEAYSYSTVHNNSLTEIPGAILTAYDTDIPLWYCALKLWVTLFGESWFVYKLFAVAGNVATMILGVTIVKRYWGYKTSAIFTMMAGMAPTILHVGVNVRMYSWTIFLITANALIAYGLVRESRKCKLWFLFALTTVAALFCHYFTAFSLLFIYLYLFVELCRYDKKSVWKIFACGIAASIPFLVWTMGAELFHLVSSGESSQITASKISMYEFWNYLFDIKMDDKGSIGCFFMAIVFLCWFLLRKRFERREWIFVLLCLSLLMVTYLLGGMVAGMASHFFITRHVIHALALMWLGVAIVLPRINPGAYIFGIFFTGMLCLLSYQKCYSTEYTTTPYIEDTLDFVAENMLPGDVVIYNGESQYDMLFRCYMPDQEFIHLSEISDIQELSGKRVWFFLSIPNFFSEEDQEKYGITYQCEGHFGFQIINNCTDFDLLRLEIAGVSEE